MESPGRHESDGECGHRRVDGDLYDFLPCFIFIFLGAPYIEVLRETSNLTSALSGVTAAVVGVVLNLALVFGAAVIWPGGLRTGWIGSPRS